MDVTPDARIRCLTPAQRELVDGNLGLVGVHLRRHVTNLRQPRRDREYDDLFQEGVLGLIEAARRYRPESGIAFAAYAFPRIHNAVSTALRRKFHLIRAPRRRDSVVDRASGDARFDARHVPTVVSLKTEPAARHAPPRAPTPEHDAATGSAAERETLGDRIRAKYERAVGRAAETLRTARGARDDRGVVIEALVRERFMIANTEARTALRRLARQTRSSYARVALCDKQIGERVRGYLESDAEMAELRRRARTGDDGADAPVDAELEHRLRELAAEAITARFVHAEATERTALLQRIVEALPGDQTPGDSGAARQVVRPLVDALSDAARERLMWDRGDS